MGGAESLLGETATEWGSSAGFQPTRRGEVGGGEGRCEGRDMPRAPGTEEQGEATTDGRSFSAPGKKGVVLQPWGGRARSHGAGKGAGFLLAVEQGTLGRGGRLGVWRRHGRRS
ncbi:hypothetical protein Zm00014a_024336 [Zea mays]|uniref:Uncharacterized protein n=1 Tax=Zea mays TaxID=4577 RepID=A0A3L6F9K0_MAIZE|nr:hypothetical protein Zm00014a_024336 [Zea mays]